MSIKKIIFGNNSPDLLNVIVVAILLLVLVAHLPSAYRDMRIRQRVSSSFHQATSAQLLVRKNFDKGVMLDSGWAAACLSCDESIKIDGITGIITIELPGDIEGGGKTLTLLPVYLLGNTQLLPADRVRLAEPIQKIDITWLCTSSGTRSSSPVIMSNLGTLRSKFSPQKCRILPSKYSNLYY